MKREILFKGKRVDNGKWIEGLIGIGFYDTTYIMDSCTYGSHLPMGGDAIGRFYKVHTATVCQLVKDDLFEGDIIERPENHKCTGEDLSIGKYQVVYDLDNLRYGLKTIKSEIFKEGAIVGFHGQLTKIGNIHDETH